MYIWSLSLCSFYNLALRSQKRRKWERASSSCSSLPTTADIFLKWNVGTYLNIERLGICRSLTGKKKKKDASLLFCRDCSRPSYRRLRGFRIKVVTQSYLRQIHTKTCVLTKPRKFAKFSTRKGD